MYMMLVPRRNGFGFFDDFFEDEFFKGRTRDLMRTDIREKDDKYIVDIDLPGFEKENINLTLNNGYLEISAKSEKENKDETDGKIVRQERFYGACSRKFYVGEDVIEEDIQAEFKNGLLKIEIPKKEETIENKNIKQIEIK